MLVLKRKIGEGIQIGDDVKITVVDSKDGFLRLAIDAPKEISIRRCEVEDNLVAHKRK